MSDPVDVAFDVFKALVWDNLVTAGIKSLALIPYVGPIFAWGPIAAVLQFFVETFVTNPLYNGLQLVVDLDVIVLRNAAAKRTFDDASVSLKIVAGEKGITSQEFKNAREKHKLEMSQYTRYYVARAA